MDGINQDQVKALIDRTLAIVGTLGALAGLVPADKWAVFANAVSNSIGPIFGVVSAALMIGSLVRGWIVNRNASKIAAAKEVPGVKGIVAVPAIANSPQFVDDPKVVSSASQVRG